MQQPSIDKAQSKVADGESNVPFGKELRLEREKLGVSLETIAEGTKFSPKFLHALEADDFDSLPGGVFQRSIIRSYCRFLGLDEQEWLNRFASIGPTGNGETDWVEFAENVKRSRIQTSSSMRPRWWGVLLMLLGLLALTWAAWHFVIKPRMHPREPIPAQASSPANLAPSNF
jgi:cytoskeletal protein RodZ